MPDPVTLTIDGRQVTAPAGTLLIEVAKSAGIEIPAFCYYPGYSLQAACRMCLVEIEKMPKLQPSCTMPVTEGMVVQTQSPKVIAARKDMLEFLLTNHPLDCPVCDKGGECELQDLTFRYGAGESRFVEFKQHTPEKQWSPIVFYDAPRCILCYRCIRVCDEGMGVGALGLSYRAVQSEIIPNRGDHLECDECGMCIDICPVGALTSGTYRYQSRPWEMRHVGTACAHCADGCRTTLSVRSGHILRANNHDRSGPNGEFLCAKGRFAYDFVHHPERLQSPLLRSDGALKPVAWSVALKAVAEKFGAIQARGGKFGVIGGAHTTNEENFRLQEFARGTLGTENIDHRRSGDVVALRRALGGRAGAWATLGDVYTTKAALVVASDLAQQHPFLAFQLRANWRHHGSSTYVVTPGPVREDKYAARSVRAARGGELAALEGLREELARHGEMVILFGDAIQGDAVAKLVAFGDSLGVPVKYICLVDAANARGAVDYGLLPGPGGLTLDEMLAAPDLDALWVVGANPLEDAALKSGAFVVVQDLFLTETAQRADVVLPAASAYEKDGTMTCVTGEPQAVVAGPSVMGTKSDLEIINWLARALGAPQAGEVRPVAVDARPARIQSAGDTLFTSGALTRYLQKLGTVREAPGQLYRG